MKFLFVFIRQPIVGGIETLISRMAGWLIDHGHEVALLTQEIAKPEQSFVSMPRLLRVIEIGDDIHSLMRGENLDSIIESWKIPSADVFKSFEPSSAWIVSYLMAYFQNVKAVGIVGCYGPNFTPPRPKWRYVFQRILFWNVVYGYSEESRLFMSHELMREFERESGCARGGVFWPLPVDASRFARIKRNPRRGLIVSVGRLHPMKGYNWAMLDILSNLRSGGVNLTWIVYGDGPDSDALKRRCRELGLDSVVDFRGDLPYKRYGEAMEDAWAFVGMGTAAVEASMCRVPAIIAICDDQHGDSYGCLSRWPFGNVGDRIRDRKPGRIQDELKRLLLLSDREYAVECDRERAFALKFDIESQMQEFLAITRNASFPRIVPGLRSIFRAYLGIKRLRAKPR